MARKRGRNSKKRRRGGSKGNASLNSALKKLVRMKTAPRRRALAQANDVFIRQLSSAVKSVRQKRLPSKLRRRLVKHQTVLRALASPSKSLSSKRKLTARQKGGFFGSILASLAAPLVGSIIKSVTSSMRND